MLVQNLVNFEMVMRAGTTEACLVAREYSEMWQHPIIGLGKLSPLLTTDLYVPTAGF